MDRPIPTTFSIDFVGKTEKINELTSKVRARIYYRGGNRNGTWITDEFAEKLNKSIPHVPIVASYNIETEDFEDHGDKGNKKAYGFVPTSPNFRWEIGNDGREYSSFDVILWSSYWPEASKIPNSSQSMELERSTIMGDWKVINGDYYFVYQEGSMKGLCALGTTTLPCFEDSAFYNLDEESRSFFQSINKINEKNLGGGNEEMDENTKVITEGEVTKFEVKDSEVIENNIQVETEKVDEFGKIVETIDETTTLTRTNDSTGINETITITGTRESVIEYPDPQPEDNDGGEVMPIMYSIEEYNAKVEEINGLNSRIVEYKIKIQNLTSEIETLNSYKIIAVKNEKTTIIEQFKKKLSEEEISEFIDSIDKYTTEELRTKLSVILADKMLKETDDVQPQHTNFVSVLGKENENGIVSILRKNKKN